MQMAVDVTELALTNHGSIETAIVVVTGDLDILPAVKKAVNNSWKIEIYTWKGSSSTNLVQYAAEHRERVTVQYLEQYIGKFTFTNMKFHMSPNMQLNSNQYGVVFEIAQGTFKYSHVPDEEWITRVERASMWPFQYYWILDDTLLIVFDAEAGFECSQFIDSIFVDDGCIIQGIRSAKILNKKEH